MVAEPSGLGDPPSADRITRRAPGRERLQRSPMKKTQRTYREDLSKTPEWLKKKKLPNRHKFLSGRRILPKGITGNSP